MDENIVYFTSVLPRLEGIFMHDVWQKIPRMIAKRIHVTSLFPSDWKDFVAEIGINDALVLEEIEISAAKQSELPLCVAFCSLLRYHCKFSDVIQALISLERVDVLSLIREDFEDFLEDWESRPVPFACSSNYNSCATTVIEVNFPHGNLMPRRNTSSENLPNETEVETNSFACPENHTEKQEGIELSSSAENTDCAGKGDEVPFEYLDSTECKKKLKDIPVIKCSCSHPTDLKVDVPMSSTKTSHPTDLKVDVPMSSTKTSHPTNLKVDIPMSATKTKFPTEIPEPISVFVPYAQKVIETGIKFANRLRKAGFIVITISEAEFLIRIDRSTFLMELLERVDFVVPVLSEDYMRYVRPSGNANRFNKDAKTNRFIFRWLHEEFENNDCYNLRVKPVIVEGFNKQLIEKEPIFTWAHQLWNEVEGLVNILHETKQMMHHLMDQWNREEFVKKWINHLNED